MTFECASTSPTAIPPEFLRVSSVHFQVVPALRCGCCISSVQSSSLVCGLSSIPLRTPRAVSGSCGLHALKAWDAGIAIGFPTLLFVKIRKLRSRGELADTETILKYSAFYGGQWLCPTARCWVRRRFLQQVARGFAFLCADYKEEGILLYWFCCQHFFEDVALAILQVSIGPHHQGDYLHLGFGAPWLIAHM